MKRFVWRLQKVLEIKTKQEQAKRTELFLLTEKLAEAQGQLLMRQRILNDVFKEVAEKEPQKRLCEQEFALKCSATNDTQNQKLKNGISELESQQRRKIGEVLKARRFKDGLEKLREVAKKQHIQEQEKLEQKELDEGATISSVRKASSAYRVNLGENQEKKQ